VPTKLTLEYVKEQFKEKGYELLSKEYENNRQKLEYKCPKGHIGFITYINFYQGNGCLKCRREYKGIEKDGKNRIYRDRDWLYNQYINKLKSTKEIGKFCNVGHRLILSWLKRFNIPTRSISESTSIGQSKYIDRNIFKRKVSKDKKLCTRCGKILHKNKFRINNTTKDGLQNYCSKCLNSLIPKKDGWRKYTKKELKSVELYRNNVKILTNYNYIKYFNIINPNKLNRSFTEYHLDHIYSVQDGFDNNINIDIISSPINLRLLSANNNISKNRKSEFSKEELCTLYIQFKEEEELWSNYT